MTPSESARLALYDRLEEILGHDNANTLMTSLPPQSASRLATQGDALALRGDFDGLRGDFERLEARFERLEDRFERLEEKLDQHMRTFYVASLSAMTGLTAIFGVIVTVFR
jgi:hypothetical protein